MYRDSDYDELLRRALLLIEFVNGDAMPFVLDPKWDNHEKFDKLWQWYKSKQVQESSKEKNTTDHEMV